MKKSIQCGLGIVLCCLSFVGYSASNLDETSVLKSMYESVILKDANQAQENCHHFEMALDKDLGQKAYQAYFKDLVLSWKRVEANYIAADMDTDMQDIPVYLDVFHLGNENIPDAIIRLLAQDQQANMALFKNSYKSFSALETVLYTEGAWTSRRYEFTKVIVSSMCSYFDDIKDFYVEHEQDFISDKYKAMEMIINRLASESFKLKDWRLGDPAGLTSKYKNRPDPMRAEYPLSHLSILASQAILEAQKSLIASQSYENFGTLLKKEGLDISLEIANLQLDKALEGLEGLEAFTPEKVQEVMKNIGHLHISYYNTILNQLPVEGKILEADGD